MRIWPQSTRNRSSKLCFWHGKTKNSSFYAKNVLTTGDKPGIVQKRSPQGPYNHWAKVAFLKKNLGTLSDFWPFAPPGETFFVLKAIFFLLKMRCHFTEKAAVIRQYLYATYYMYVH